MKKVTIGILVLIPVIIMVVVSLVSVFVSTRTHIAVDNVELSHSSIDIELSENTYDLNDYLAVTVLPDKATNKSYKWSFEEIVCLDESYLADWENGVVAAPATLVNEKNVDVDENSTGLFKVNSYCSFYAVAQAETMKARCLVYVVGYEVKSVTLTAEYNSELKVGEKLLLSPNYTPVDSIVGDTVWESDNESVATVDGNGVVSAKNVGTANITVRAKVFKTDEYVLSSPYSVTVSSGVSFFGTEIAVHETSVPLSSLGISSAVAVEGCTVESGNVVFATGIILAKISVGGQTVTLKRVDENAIAIINSEIFAYTQDDEHFVLEAAGLTSGETLLPLRLSVKWASDLKSGKPSAIEWSSERPAIASVDNNGNVVGKADGIVKITARAGNQTAVITLDVRKKVTTLSLDKTTQSLAVGIAKETVFADMVYVEPDNPDNHAVTENSIKINFMRPFMDTNLSIEEKTAFYEAFDFSISLIDGIQYAYFEENTAVLKFNSANIENYYQNNEERLVLTVTVKAKYPKYKSHASYTTCTFDINVVHGVCVSSYASLFKATNDYNDVCLISNVQRLTNEDPTILIRGALYGNNFTISGSDSTVPYRSFQLIKVRNDGVKISNVCLRLIGDIQEEINGAEDNVGLKGICVFVEGYDDSPTRLFPHLKDISFEYSIFENCCIAVRIYGGSVKVNGCIIRNTSEVAFYVPTSIEDKTGEDGIHRPNYRYSELTMRNCVMSNMVGTAFSFHYNNFSNGSNQFNSKEQAEEAFASGYNTVLYQEGFFDIYNWQELNVLNLLPPGTLEEKYQNALNAAIRIAIGNSDVREKYSVKHNGVDYFHLGFISTGISEKTYLETHFEDKRIQRLVSDDILPITLGDYAVLLYTYGKSYGDLHPNKTYEVNSTTIDKLNGKTQAEA